MLLDLTTETTWDKGTDEVTPWGCNQQKPDSGKFNRTNNLFFSTQK